VVVFLVVAAYSQPVQSCVQSEYSRNPNYAKQEYATRILAAFDIQWGCDFAFLTGSEGEGLITALATLAVAVFTGTLWAATTAQGRLTVKALRLARDEFDSTHRPKLHVRNVVLQHSVPPNLQPLGMIAQGQPVVGHLQIVNIGAVVGDIVESHCRVWWTPGGGLPMEPPYERDPPNNFAGTIRLHPGEPHRVDFHSTEPMGADAEIYASGVSGTHHLYVMGWIQYGGLRRAANQPRILLRMAFCRVYRIVGTEQNPRFHIVNDKDYEYED
jgi:hypothetical protein